MTERIKLNEFDPEVMKHLLGLGNYLKHSGLDQKLVELVNYRVSQINGCVFCLDMHHKEALAQGEEELRLHALSAWKDSPYYSDKERIVLEFAEVLTYASQEEVSDSLFNQLKTYYSESEISDLTLAVTLINTWNRINKTFQPIPGKYEVGQFN